MLSFNNGTSTANDTEVKQCLLTYPVTWHPSFTNQATNIVSIVVVALQLLTSPFVIFLNAVTLILVAKFHTLQQERFVVLALLAVTDFLSGLISQPLFVAKELVHILTNKVNCSVDGAVYISHFIFSGTSFYQLACLTYERYVAISAPFEYPYRITTRRLLYVTVANWIIHITLQTVVATTTINNVFGALFFIYMIYLIICTVVMLSIVYWYVVIFTILRKQHRQISSEQPNDQRTSRIRNNLSNQRSATTAALLVGSFSFSYLPTAVELFMVLYFGDDLRGPGYFAFHPWAELSLQLNSLYSPIIYGLRCRVFRRYFFRLFRVQQNVINAHGITNE